MQVEHPGDAPRGEGIIPRDAGDQTYGGVPIRQTELRADAFDYVALGHYHVATEVARNVWYAGALEYVTTNPWGESRERGAAGAPGEKGWLLVECRKKLKVLSPTTSATVSSELQWGDTMG